MGLWWRREGVCVKRPRGHVDGEQQWLANSTEQEHRDSAKGKKENEKQCLLDPICSLQSLNRTLRQGMAMLLEVLVKILKKKS
jgi:hypothetical protein